MKRTVVFLLCVLLALSFFGCSQKNPALISGYYCVQGEYLPYTRPYVRLETEENIIFISGGVLSSYADKGTYRVSDGILTAQIQDTTLTFEIKNDKTLVMTHDCDLPAKFTAGMKFVFSTDTK